MSKITKSAKNQPCTLNVVGVCKYRTGTTVMCHVRDFSTGGMRLKPSDFCAVFGCFECHRWLDRLDHREVAIEDRFFYIARGIVRTIEALYNMGIIKLAGEK